MELEASLGNWKLPYETGSFSLNLEASHENIETLNPNELGRE